jgi:C4-dicarboxylate transporter DctQ subunit
MQKKIFDKIISRIICVLFLAMVICIFIGVINRAVIKASIPWTEEIARYSMIWMTFLSIGMGLKKGAHIGVEILVSKLAPVKRHIFNIIAISFFIIFSLVIIITSFSIIGIQINTKQASAALGLPMFIPYFAIPVGMFIAFIEELKMLIKEVRTIADIKKTKCQV